MTLNFDAFRTGKASYAETVRDVSHTDLYQATNDLFDTFDNIITGLTDMGATFVPHDVDLKEGDTEGAFTLGHVIVHLTATLEETAAVGSIFARGVQFEGRLRYEVPWQTIHTAQQVHARLRESHRMCKAYLDTWPDAPHLDITIVRIPSLGPMNAVGVNALGILHATGHIKQLQEIMRQSHERV